MLHITNGDAVNLEAAGIEGGIVRWRDGLHEGPAPAALPLGEFSRARAGFLSGRGWGGEEEIAAQFAARNAALEGSVAQDEVVLWFEHDLYDQLQLIQILDWFLTHERRNLRLSLICIGKFPGIGRFKGLGELSGAQLASLFPQRQEVTLADLKSASEAWAAFTSPDPRDVEWAAANPSLALPFLRGALGRHLEQFPSVRNGLARTEQQILEIVAAGVGRFEDLFLQEQDREERVFLGDATFAWYVERMIEAPEPLVERRNGNLRVTPAGGTVLAATTDAVRLNGIDRWLGGVHLEGREADWRWDTQTRRLVARADRH